MIFRVVQQKQPAVLKLVNRHSGSTSRENMFVFKKKLGIGNLVEVENRVLFQAGRKSSRAERRLDKKLAAPAAEPAAQQVGILRGLWHTCNSSWFSVRTRTFELFVHVFNIYLQKNGALPATKPESSNLTRAPHSFIFHRGKIGRSIMRLVRDMRNVMEPFTATKLKVVFFFRSMI